VVRSNSDGAELVLEAADGAAEPGLRDARELARAGEVPLVGERHHVLHLPEVHIRPASFSFVIRRPRAAVGWSIRRLARRPAGRPVGPSARRPAARHIIASTSRRHEWHRCELLDLYIEGS
jgi:hypothetical protein